MGILGSVDPGVFKVDIKEFQVISNRDGLSLAALRAEPDGAKPIGVVQLVHGMTEHKERYLPFMEFLAAHGFASVIYDHRGHGHSVRSQADLGYFGSHGALSAVEDLHQMVQYTHSLFPALPVHLLGHSMGSLIVRCYLQSYDDEIVSLTVSGCVGPNPLAGLGQGIVKVLKLVLGERHRSRLITQLAFGAYNKAFQPVMSPNAWICSDPEVVKAYDQHPLCGFTFTLNGYETLFDLVKRCYRKEGWRVMQPQLPIFFVSGAEDPCMNGMNGFLDAISFLKERGYEDVQGTTIQGMRHEVMNEIGKEKVYAQILHHIETAQSSL
jgi:alpha-beta hydrolase superfamily lysophospholipase